MNGLVWKCVPFFAWVKRLKISCAEYCVQIIALCVGKAGKAGKQTHHDGDMTMMSH